MSKRRPIRPWRFTLAAGLLLGGYIFKGLVYGWSAWAGILMFVGVACALLIVAVIVNLLSSRY